MPSEIMRGGVSVPTPEPDHLAIAEESLLAKEDSLKRQLAHIQGVIANLRSERGVSSGELPEVKRDEFRGRRAADGLEVYLRTRKGSKIPLSTIVKDLVAGGVHPGAKRARISDPEALVMWNLKITLTSPTSRFKFEPQGTDPKTGKTIIPDGVRPEDILVWLSDKADVPKRRVYYKRPKR